MFNPCYEHCYLRYGKEYTEECDNTCQYAYLAKKAKSMAEDIHTLLGNWFCALEDEGCPNPFEYRPCLEMANKYGYTNKNYVKFKTGIC